MSYYSQTDLVRNRACVLIRNKRPRGFDHSRRGCPGHHLIMIMNPGVELAAGEVNTEQQRTHDNAVGIFGLASSRLAIILMLYFKNYSPSSSPIMIDMRPLNDQSLTAVQTKSVLRGAGNLREKIGWWNVEGSPCYVSGSGRGERPKTGR